MHDEKLKLFLHGLPPDCQENPLKDFLEAVYGLPGVITKVSIPSKKTYAFVTVSHTEVADNLLRNTLLYCDGNGQFYQIKACRYVKRQFKTKQLKDQLPENKSKITSVSGTSDPKPAQYEPPQHVHQLTPDYSMLLLSKPKRKRRKRDDSTVWFGGIGSTTSKTKPKRKKKKKQASKLEVHKSESFQFGNLCPADVAATTNTTELTLVEPVIASAVQVTGQKSAKQQQNVPEMDLNASKYSGTDSSQTQVIIDHSYLGPLCLQFTNPSSVADVKSEIMERTGLPVKDQYLYCNGKKLRDDLSLRPLLGNIHDSLTLTLSEGSLKGGVRPKEEREQEEGAVGGERDPSALQTEAMQSMETWDPRRTAAWLCEIGERYEKYADICQKEDINGWALLLLASKDRNQLRSVLNLKRGPEAVMMDHLEPHLEIFERDKLQTARPSTEVMNRWTCEELCTWLRKLGTPQECLTNAEEEEIDGQAFLSLSKSGELRECLQLKVGPWIVLQHELLLHMEEKTGSYSDKAGSSLPTKGMDESKEPLAADDPITKTLPDTCTPPKPALSKEEEKLLLLKNALKLDIEASVDSEDRNVCLVRSMFVKRGKGANPLESLVNFVVITRDELTADKPRKLWTKIVEKTMEWMKLLSKEDLETFRWNEQSGQFLYKPSNEEVSLRDGKVGQIFLEKLSDDELKKSYFVILIDKQFLEPKNKKYRFSFDRNNKKSYVIKLKLEGKYHAAFDFNNPSLDLKWSKYFNSLKNVTSDLAKDDPTAPQRRDQRPICDKPLYQIPRPFNREYERNGYTRGFVLNCWETGPKDMITPVHECKIFRTDVNSSEDEMVKKFVYETLRFACACLNERTNGTIHFGVADEVEAQACGHIPREIVGSVVTNEPLYNEKLTEFISKCFVGPSGSIVHNCIRPPVFMPVRGSFTEQHISNKVVIEVDIEPSYSLCAGEIFKASFRDLNRGKKDREATAFVRLGSHTKAIVDLAEMEEYIKNRLPKLDKERKSRELALQRQSSENRDAIKELFSKLQRLLCANKKFLDTSVYPILVLSKPDASMEQPILDETFRFIQKIKWLTVIDFDDQGSDSNGLCKVFKSSPDSPQVDIHEAEDYDGDDNAVDNIYYKTHWIFGNGYVKLKKEAVGFKQWNNSKRKRGLSQVIQSLAKTIPDVRAVVLFLLLSKDYQAMADTFKDFCTYLDGPNQLVYVAENSEIVRGWEGILSNTCLEEHELRERGVVGMSWPEFQECVQQMVCGSDPKEQRYVTMATGSPYPLGNVTFNCIDIVSARQCEELNNLSSVERSKLSSEVETQFYRGYPVTWKNFWFTDTQKNHVLRRDNYSQLRNLLENIYSRKSEGRVQTITIYHHIAAGASTMTRQALWDFRCNAKFPFRCAVVKKIDDSTCKELLHLRKIGYGEVSEAPFPPLLTLVEDIDDLLFRELRSQVVEQASKLPRTYLPVCVFLYCKTAQEPYKCHLKEKATSVYLEQHLSRKEVEWFKDKYTEMKQKSRKKDPERDFEEYANDNLISFMIMKENYNPEYASSIVARNLDLVTGNEFTMLKYSSLLNIYNPFPVFASCFDALMLSSSLLRKRIFRDWVEDLTHSARIFLREVDCSTHSGTGKAIAIVHPNIAGELLDQVATREQTTVSRVTLEFLKSPLLQSEAKSFTSAYLLDGAKRMLKHRRKYEYGDEEKTKFAPLIEKILYEKDDTGGKETTVRNVYEAVEVLKAGLEKFEDPMLAQQMARVFTVNAATFVDSGIEECFRMALTYCNKAIEMKPNNPSFFDTMGRIYEKKMKVLYGPIRKDTRIIDPPSATSAVELAFQAMKWFQKAMGASGDYQNPCHFRGEMSVMFYLLDVLRCTILFGGQDGLTKLQGYLAVSQVIPPEVQELWSKFHEGIKDLRNRFSHCMEGLTEEFTIYKGTSEEARLLPAQIAGFKKQYRSYFGESDLNWNPDNPIEQWEYRWQQINQILAGDIFSTVFKLDASKARETLTLLKKLAFENYCEQLKDVVRYKDLLLLITTNMALHSPYGDKSKKKSDQMAAEYKDIFKLVDQLFALEESVEGNKRLYAHLLKVMFLWPRKDMELGEYHLQDFYAALKKLKMRWDSKCKGHIDTDKMLTKKMYKYMSFKKETRQYTTLFFLGKGKGLDVFVHINELPLSRNTKGSPAWEDGRTKQRLERLTGVVESRNIIRMKNPLDGSQMIDIYYSSFREGGFSKEEVSFYLGFSWPQPTAFDVKYTKEGHDRKSVESSDLVFGDQFQFGPHKYVMVTYEEYKSRKEKIMKKLTQIDSLKKKKNRGEKLDENQEKKISKEEDLKRELQELEESFDSMDALEDEIFD